MIIAGFELPDKCPEDCPFTDDIANFGQNAICGRCPLFCCVDNGAGFVLVEPEGYRPDWAEVWSVWLAGPMDTYPQLLLEPKVDDDGNVTKLTHEYYDFNSQIIKNDY